MSDILCQPALDVPIRRLNDECADFSVEVESLKFRLDEFKSYLRPVHLPFVKIINEIVVSNRCPKPLTNIKLGVIFLNGFLRLMDSHPITTGLVDGKHAVIYRLSTLAGSNDHLPHEIIDELEKFIFDTNSIFYNFDSSIMKSYYTDDEMIGEIDKFNKVVSDQMSHLPSEFDISNESNSIDKFISILYIRNILQGFSTQIPRKFLKIFDSLENHILNGNNDILINGSWWRDLVSIALTKGLTSELIEFIGYLVNDGTDLSQIVNKYSLFYKNHIPSGVKLRDFTLTIPDNSFILSHSKSQQNVENVKNNIPIWFTAPKRDEYLFAEIEHDVKLIVANSFNVFRNVLIVPFHESEQFLKDVESGIEFLNDKYSTKPLVSVNIPFEKYLSKYDLQKEKLASAIKFVNQNEDMFSNFDHRFENTVIVEESIKEMVSISKYFEEKNNNVHIEDVTQLKNTLLKNKKMKDDINAYFSKVFSIIIKSQDYHKVLESMDIFISLLSMSESLNTRFIYQSLVENPEREISKFQEISGELRKVATSPERANGLGVSMIKRTKIDLNIRDSFEGAQASLFHWQSNDFTSSLKNNLPIYTLKELLPKNIFSHLLLSAFFSASSNLKKVYSSLDFSFDQQINPTKRLLTLLSKPFTSSDTNAIINLLEAFVKYFDVDLKSYNSFIGLKLNEKAIEIINSIKETLLNKKSDFAELLKCCSAIKSNYNLLNDISFDVVDGALSKVLRILPNASATPGSSYAKYIRLTDNLVRSIYSSSFFIPHIEKIMPYMGNSFSWDLDTMKESILKLKSEIIDSDMFSVVKSNTMSSQSIMDLKLKINENVSQLKTKFISSPQIITQSISNVINVACFHVIIIEALKAELNRNTLTETSVGVSVEELETYVKSIIVNNKNKEADPLRKHSSQPSDDLLKVIASATLIFFNSLADPISFPVLDNSILTAKQRKTLESGVGVIDIFSEIKLDVFLDRIESFLSAHTHSWLLYETYNMNNFLTPYYDTLIEVTEKSWVYFQPHTMSKLHVLEEMVSSTNQFIHFMHNFDITELKQKLNDDSYLLLFKKSIGIAEKYRGSFNEMTQIIAHIKLNLRMIKDMSSRFPSQKAAHYRLFTLCSYFISNDITFSESIEHLCSQISEIINHNSLFSDADVAPIGIFSDSDIDSLYAIESNKYFDTIASSNSFPNIDQPQIEEFFGKIPLLLLKVGYSPDSLSSAYELMKKMENEYDSGHFTTSMWIFDYFQALNADGQLNHFKTNMVSSLRKGKLSPSTIIQIALILSDVDSRSSVKEYLSPFIFYSEKRFGEQILQIEKKVIKYVEKIDKYMQGENLMYQLVDLSNSLNYMLQMGKFIFQKTILSENISSKGWVSCQELSSISKPLFIDSDLVSKYSITLDNAIDQLNSLFTETEYRSYMDIQLPSLDSLQGFKSKFDITREEHKKQPDSSIIVIRMTERLEEAQLKANEVDYYSVNYLQYHALKAKKLNASHGRLASWNVLLSALITFGSYLSENSEMLILDSTSNLELVLQGPLFKTAEGLDASFQMRHDVAFQRLEAASTQLSSLSSSLSIPSDQNEQFKLIFKLFANTALQGEIINELEDNFPDLNNVKNAKKWLFDDKKSNAVSTDLLDIVDKTTDPHVLMVIFNQIKEFYLNVLKPIELLISADVNGLNEFNENINSIPVKDDPYFRNLYQTLKDLDESNIQQIKEKYSIIEITEKSANILTSHTHQAKMLFKDDRASSNPGGNDHITPEENTNAETMSGGAIALLVIGVCFLVALCSYFGFSQYKKHKKNISSPRLLDISVSDV